MTNNWDAYSHRALYDMIHGRLPGGWEHITARFEGLEPGAGVAGAESALQCWAELAALMDQARAATELALREAGASWEGLAADAMQSGVTPLAQWAADANTAGSATQSSVDGHVASFSSAQHRMPEPVPVAANGLPTTFADIFAGQTDQDRQEAAAQEAKVEAMRVMTGYEGESTAAAISLGRFVPPPSVTVDVPPANPIGGEIGSFGGAFVGPTGGSGGSGGGGGRARAGSPDSAGSDAGGAPDTTQDAQVTTPEQGVPIGGATPTPGTQPDQVTQRSSTPPSPGPAGVDAIAGRPQTGGGRRPQGGVGGAPPSPGRGGAGVPGTPGVAGARGGAGPTVARGFAGTSMVPLGAYGPAKGDPDRDHKPPAYLRDTHDDFWDDTPKVSSPVIGEEEE